MTNTTESSIQVTDEIHLVLSKNGSSNTGTYTPRVFRKGGEEFFNPKTLEKSITTDKWVDVPLYFTNLIHALRWCAQEEVERQGYSTIPLEEYISRLESVWKR